MDEKKKKDEQVEKEKQVVEIVRKHMFDDTSAKSIMSCDRRKSLLIYKTISEELADTVNNQNSTPPRQPFKQQQLRKKSFTAKTRRLPGSIVGMCRRRGLIRSHIKTKFITREFFVEKIKEVIHHCDKIVPKLTVTKTNEMLKKEMPRLVKLAVNKDREVSPVDISEYNSQSYPKTKSSTATTSSVDLQLYRLDWNNPKTDRYPFDLSKPLPLQGHPGYLNVAADYFFNNDLEYLKSSDPERTYTMSITKTKAAQYEIEGIEDMLNKSSKHNVYSTKKILGVKSVSVKKLYGYRHLEEIMVKRADRQFYKFKEDKLFHLTDSDIVDFIVALCMFTRSLVIKKRVKDLQLGVESYQKKLNITPPQQTKFRDELHHRIRDFHLEYNTDMPRRKWTAINRIRSKLMVELIDKQMRERRIIQNLERLVGARELEMDYKLMMRTT
ncbi:hypothetical protein Tco_0400422 [Tanacetum coccineum]